MGRDRFEMNPVHMGGALHGSALGRYEVLAPIGSGGMAAIYLARIAGPAGFEKLVALKVIHSHLAEDPEFVQMFLDEARIASLLQHPNIVQIFDLGQEQGVYFIAMEYLRGETVGALVQRLIRSGRRLIDPRMACSIAMQACEALHHAHELTDMEGCFIGLVHRDVSPQNLFITYAGSVKLMDFGIARAVGLAHTTRPGSLKGKFSYMSPEQARGRSIDRRSDLFGLGVVLWEMLTGKRLFKGANDIDSLSRVSEAVVPPVGEMRSGVPANLDAVLARSLAREPEDRYQTALELHEDLGIVADQLGSPVTTHELAKHMAKWFPDGEQAKKALLVKTVPVMRRPSFSARGAGSADGDTPSVSETSGVRLRDLEVDGEPSVSNAGIDQVFVPSPSDVPRPLRPPEALSLPDETVEEDVRAGRGRTGRMVAVLAGVLALGIAVGAAAYFGPRHYWGRQDRIPVGGGMAQAPPPELGMLAPAAVAFPLLDAAAEAAPAFGHDAAVAGEPEGGIASPGPDQTVTVRLALRPVEARVFVDGEAAPDPAALVLARSDEPVAVLVTAPGHEPASFTLVPREDSERRVSLRRRRRGSADDEDGTPTKRPPRDGELVSNPYAPR